MGLVRKVDWFGGMNSQLDPTKGQFGVAYWLGVNIRTRANTCASVRGPLDITEGLPSGLTIQGLYAFDRSLLAFVGGGAYYKTNSTGPWIQIAGFAMSAAVAEIDVEPIPSSSVNFIRSAVYTETQKDNDVVLGNPLQPSPAALIVMDGVSQPKLIFPDATWRNVQTYAEWTPENAEYVPIARHPCYINGVLYCVGVDGNNNPTQVFRSVTGKPCDFVILVNTAGNKISGDESVGGASVLATRVSYAPVTAVGKLNVGTAALLVSTLNNTYAVIPDYDHLIAAEPQFTHVPLADVGAVNKNSVANVLGDTTIITRAGVRSFNGVKSLNWEGKNAPFSAAVNNFISSQSQTVTAVGVFDNYALYALTTVFGPAVLVFDMLSNSWVSIDRYPGVGLIKQFAAVQSGVTEELFFVTDDNKVYKAFAGDTITASVFLSEITPAEVGTNHSVSEVTGVFSDVRTAGYVESSVRMDRVLCEGASQYLQAPETPTITPANVPFNSPSRDVETQQATFNYDAVKRLGWRAMIGLSWSAEASLLEVGAMLVDPIAHVKPPVEVLPELQAFTLTSVANDWDNGANRALVNAALRRVNADVIIGAGNHTTAPGTAADITASLKAHWDLQRKAGKFAAAPGLNELATSGGLPFYDYIQQGPDHYSAQTFGDAVTVFFLTADAAFLAGQEIWLAAQPAAKYKIGVIAKPPASSVSGVSLLATDWTALGINLLLTPAGNVYERLVLPTGLTVINNGCGGSVAMPSNTPTPSTLTAKIVNRYGFLQLYATPLRLTVKFIGASDGATLDTTNL